MVDGCRFHSPFIDSRGETVLLGDSSKIVVPKKGLLGRPLNVPNSFNFNMFFKHCECLTPNAMQAPSTNPE